MGFDFNAARLAPPLDAHVECVWAVCGDVPYRRSIVLPNGALHLMFNFGAPNRVLAFGDHRAARREVGAST